MKVTTLFYSILFLAVSGVKADFSDSIYDTLTYLANYAKISYCAVEPYFGVGNLEKSCPRIDFCDSDESRDVAIVQVSTPNLLQLEISGDGFVAVDPSQKRVYVVFKGSLTPGDFITDVLFGYCPYAPILKNDNINSTLFEGVNSDTKTGEISDLIKENADEIVCEDCYVHCGVYVAFSQFIEEVHAAAAPYLNDGYQLVVTGHSLAGGYAGLAGIEFLLKGYKPLVITYASLRIGNPAFNRFVDEKFNTKGNAEVVANGGDLPIPSYSRVYQKTDIVPRLPPGPGYTHSGLQFEITKLRLPQLKKDVQFNGASDNDENSPLDVDLSDPLALLVVYQHLHYFTRISWPCDDFDINFLAKREEYEYTDLLKRSFFL